MRCAGVVALAGVLSFAAAAGADDTTPFAPGTRLRVTTPRGRIVGRLLDVDEENLTLLAGNGEARTIPRAHVTALAVSTDRHTRGQGALVGAAVGIVVGASVGFAIGDDPPDSFFQFSARDKALAGVVVLAPLGAVVGAVWPPSERWVNVSRRIRVSLRPVPGPGAGVSVAVAF